MSALAPSTRSRAAVFTGFTRRGQAFSVFERVAAIDPGAWSAAFASHWKDERYYQTLEATMGAEFTQRCLVIWRANGDGALAIQPFFFVDQDLTVSLPAWARACLRPLQERLKTRILMAGCIVGDAQMGVADPALLPQACEAVDDSLDQYARREGVSLVLFKDMPAEYRAAMRPLVSRGRLTVLPSLPAVTLELDFKTFDEYVQERLGKATRKSLRRKFRDIARAAPVSLEVKQSITPEEADILHALYAQVAGRGDVHFEVFTPEYFLRLGECMPEQTRYFIWRQAGRVIAFSFCTLCDGVIYDNDLGMDPALASPMHLYHLTFRDIIRWALAHGIQRYSSSPFNYDPKLHLRMDLAPLDLYARHRNRLANFFLRRFAPLAAPTRREAVLREFANAADMNPSLMPVRA